MATFIAYLGELSNSNSRFIYIFLNMDRRVPWTGLRLIAEHRIFCFNFGKVLK